MRASVDRETDLRIATRQFEESLLNETLPVYDDLGVTNETFPNTHVYTLWANWTGVDNSTLLYGRTENFSYTPLQNTNSSLLDTTVTGTVQAFIPSMECRSLDVEVNSHITATTYYLARRDVPDKTKRVNARATTIASDSAPTASTDYTIELSLSNGFCDSWPSMDIAIPDPYDETLPGREIYGWRTHFLCGSDGSNTSTEALPAEAWPPSNGYKSGLYQNYTPSGYLFFVADYRHQKVPEGSNQTNLEVSRDLGSDAPLVIPTIQAVSCQPSYDMAKVNLTSKFQQNATTPKEISLSDPFDFQSRDNLSLSATDLLRAIEATFANVEYLFEDNHSSSTVNNNDTFIGFMGLAENSTGSLEPLLDKDRIIHASGKAFGALMSGVAWEALLSNSSTQSTPVDVTWSVDKLTVHEGVLWPMVVLFIILGLFSTGLVFLAVSRFVTAEPGSIGSYVAVLAHSPTLRNMLHGTSVMTHEAPSVVMKPGSNEGSRGGKQPRYQSLEKGVQPLSRGSTAAKSIEPSAPSWWRPSSLKPWVLGISISLPLILIIILEALQQTSDRHSGFSAVSNSMAAQVLARLIPAALGLVVSTLIGSIDGRILMLAPFAALKKTAQPPEVLANNLLIKTSTSAMYYSIKLGYVGAPLTALAVLFGSLLPIAASGLYTLDSVPFDTAVVAYRQDFFNMSGVSTGQSQAAATLSLMERQEQPNPENTYDGLALPSLSLDFQGSNFTGNVVVTVPAYRAMLDCTPIPSDEYLGIYQDSAVSFWSNVTHTCDNGVRTYGRPDDANKWGLGYKGLPAGGTYWGEAFYKDNKCDSFSYCFGHVEWACASNETSCYDNSNLTIVECAQQIQEVSVRVTYTDSTLTTIDDSNPPVVDESSAKLVEGGNGTFFPYTFSGDLDNTFQAWDFAGTSLTADQQQPFDTFFQIVTQGKDGVSADDLRGSANEGRLDDRVLQVYRKYMALVFNTNGRQACTGADSEPESCRQTVVGSAVPSRTRVRQDKTSKIMLQVLLGLMSLLSLLAILLTRTKDVLLDNPCSLAASMGLVADSWMVQLHEERSSGLEDTITKDGLKSAMKRLGDGFALGVWQGREAGEQFYGVDVRHESTAGVPKE